MTVVRDVVEHLVCRTCDADPLQDPSARKWAESPLRGPPPAK